MLTRGEIYHQYYPAPVQQINMPGSVRVTTGSGPQKDIIQTWAIARPSSAPMSNGAPFYVNGYSPNLLIGGGIMPLRMSRPRVEMDPSDSSTWQREYRFTR